MPEARETRKPQGYAGPKNPPKKPRSKASPARLAALDVVRAVRERDAFAQDVIGTRIDRSDLSSEDRAFATKLALGVVSATGTLDEIIDRALNAPSDVKPDVRDALRVSTYEIIFLGKTPHAAVDQGVELVRSFAMSASGLANAVLRKIVLMRQAFPFGDPMRDPEALARLHAFPLWLARKLIVDLGPQEALDFMRASNEQAPLFIAVNAAKTSDEALVKAFDKLDEGLDPVSVDGVSVAGCYRVLDTRALLLPEVKRMFSQGKILVTDAASQLVAASVLPERKPASLLRWAPVAPRRRSCCKAMRRAPTAHSWSCLRLTTMRSRRGFCWSAPSATARRWPRRSRATRWSWTPWWGTAPSTRCSSTPRARGWARCAAIPRSAGASSRPTSLSSRACSWACCRLPRRTWPRAARWPTPRAR